MTPIKPGAAQEAEPPSSMAHEPMPPDAHMAPATAADHRASSDQLIEQAIAYAKPNPLRLLQVCWWMTRGRQFLQGNLAAVLRSEQGATALPSPARTEAGAELAGPEPVAMPARPAAATPGPARTTATVTILHSVAKPAWAAAATADDAAPAPDATTSPRQSARMLLAGMRPHQWAKNGLVFVPIALAGELFDLGGLIDTALAFTALCVVASTTYLVNDLWDVADDRRHWSKRQRPLASGRLPMSHAMAAVPVGIIAGFLIGAMASMAVAGFLLVYLLVTLGYSLGLKRVPILDGVVLATLFTLRLGLGIVAADVAPSPWLIVVSMFLFASLSYAKRYLEIERVATLGGDWVGGRGYRTIDSPLVLAIGVSTGIGAVVIMAIYVANDAITHSFYGNPAFLWAFPALLFAFVGRIWLVCLRDQMDDDPVAFALADWQCLGLLGMVVIAFGLAWLGPI